jgi:type IV pilus assembly protein PilA
MKTCLNKLRTSKGFTLIELLVVIGILGILAATLVATIDPFEQLRKANDTKVQNATVEFQTALIRYYTGQNGFPWSVDGSACQTNSGAVQESPNDPWNITTPVTLETAVDCIESDTDTQDLVDTGELKASFTEVTGVLDKIYLSSEGTNVTVCYMPDSKAGQNDKGAHYTDEIGTEDVLTEGVGTCKANGGTEDCYWCTK